MFGRNRKGIDDSRYATSDGLRLPSVDEVPFWLCEDVVFREIFGRKAEKNEDDPLKYLTNSTLRNAKMDQIVKMTLKNPILPRRRRRFRGVVLDVCGEDENGVAYDIEMQRYDHPAFMDRVFFYGSRLFADQLNVGDDYSKLRRVVTIVFTTFSIRKDKDVWFDVYRNASKFDPNDVYNGMTTIFVRIPTRKEHCPTRIDDPELKAWLKLFGYPKLTSDEEANEMEMSYPVFRNVRTRMRRFFDVSGWREINSNRLAFADGMAIGREDGIKQGREDGIKLGREDGIKLGREDGMKLGREFERIDATREFVVRTLRNRFPNEPVVAFGLTSQKLAGKSRAELERALDESERCASLDDFLAKI